MSTVAQIGFDKMNRLGLSGTPFFFVIDFDVNQVVVHTLDELPKDIRFKLDEKNSANTNYQKKELPVLRKEKYNKVLYKEGFNKVQKAIQRGDTYLCNFTASIPVTFNDEVSLEDIYNNAEVSFKLKYKDDFVCFSPERFVKINDNKIYTYPMKGTAVETDENSLELLLKDPKEMAEHCTIVDLLRNDLGIICDTVAVNKFRYPTRIKKRNGVLLQISSEIEGTISKVSENKFGDIFKKILPAGSISGAPKNKTVEVIKNTENHKRGFYTGVFGVFDGVNLDSAVAIRFIEKTPKGLIYKSGGGVTYQSEMEKEYNEMMQKVYVPIY